MWLKRVFITSVVLVIMAACRPACAQATWTDPTTKLTWTTLDNGADLSWYQAFSYCTNLRLGNYVDWRLPEIDELRAIYEPHTGFDTKPHVRGPIHFTQIFVDIWSNSPGSSDDRAFYFDFQFGSASSNYKEISVGQQALCVRRP